jgi:hypothetical protein
LTFLLFFPSSLDGCHISFYFLLVPRKPATAAIQPNPSMHPSLEIIRKPHRRSQIPLMHIPPSQRRFPHGPKSYLMSVTNPRERESKRKTHP